MDWGPSAMADTQSVAMLINSTTSKIRQLQQAFAELESHRAVSLNLKWKELEEHFHGLERSLRKRFNELEDQEKEFQTKVLEAQEMLEKREAVVEAKEQASLERLQEKRDAALFAIGDALEKYKKVVGEPFTKSMSNDHADAILEEKPAVKAATPDSSDAKPARNDIMEVNPRPELIKLCEEMDSKGLHKFISDNRKDLSALREEIPFALKRATDPGRLVLDSMEDFYSMEIPLLDGKRESSLLGLRRTCIMLMESLMSLLTDMESDPAADSSVISSRSKEQAKAIADEWKPKLDHLDTEACYGNSLEAHAFLQLLATFGIVSEFNQHELCKLIPLVSRRRQTAELCRFLGLTEKMPEVVEVLVNSGRQLEAINLAYAFELTDKFDPVSLLKAYLKEARKGSQVKAGNASPVAQNEANERELCALKVVIKSIEEHKLEEQYPVDPLQKRVIQLEKAKADKKRVAEAAKPQSKRPRANGGTYGPRITNIPEKCGYRGSERFPFAYDRPYLYPADNHGSSLLGSAFYSPPHNPGSYYGNGYQYPATYLH
ncbi:hypothetical protein AAC387_Pa05g0521 [Persea americana]